MRREEDDERDVGTVISLSLPPQRRDVMMMSSRMAGVSATLSHVQCRS